VHLNTLKRTLDKENDMGQKYMINCFNYPYKGYYIGDKQSQYFLKFIFQLIICLIKYDGVDIQVRKTLMDI